MSETILSLLERTVSNHGQRPALREKRDGRWQEISWFEYRRLVLQAGRALLKLGLEEGEGVVIMGFNRPEWFIADLAAISAGAVPTGLYDSSTTDQCTYIAAHCGARVAFLQDSTYLPKLDRTRLPELTKVVLMRGEAPSDALTWEDFLELGDSVSESQLRSRIDAADPDDLCTLIYTSGTTGTPKGVMLSHRNLTWTSAQMAAAIAASPDDSQLSYLPLSHIAEQTISLYMPMNSGSCTWFAESMDTIPENLRDVRPTVFFSVPRLWEKMESRIRAIAANNSPWRRVLMAWARKQGLAGGRAASAGRRLPLGYRTAERLVFSQIRKRLGLDRARLLATSAAPISLETLEYFVSLGMPIMEGYGLSEVTGPATFSLPGRFRIGKPGFAVPGSEIRIADDGEILIRGPHVCAGYFRDEEASREVLDHDGWFHTGDLGSLDADGFLEITGRKKDLLVTSGGKNVAPQGLESWLCGIPLVSQAVIVGDRRKYLAALLTLDPDLLESEARLAGSPARSVEEAAVCPHIRKRLEAAIEVVNARVARYENIRRFAVLPSQLSVEGGELTPTMKIKRAVVSERYSEVIESLYADRESSAQSPSG